MPTACCDLGAYDSRGRFTLTASFCSLRSPISPTARGSFMSTQPWRDEVAM